MSVDRRDEWALWRFSILGPLVSARLFHGDRQAYFRQTASRHHLTPDGKTVRLSKRTIETWFYAWRRGGLEALKREARSDRGQSHIPEWLQEKLVALKSENPCRSIRRLIRMLERSGEVTRGELSRSSVQRFLKGRGLSGRSGSAEPVERRSFRHQDPGDLWMGDVLHGPVVVAKGRLRKSYVIAFIDSATRFVPAAEVRLSEGAPDHESVLKQAFFKHGLPRALYLDNGAAQRSHSLRMILAELSVRLIHARPYEPASKGAIERWNRTLRDEVLRELPDPEDPLAIDELQSRIWAWLSVEYNARIHSTTGRIPREDWLRDPSLLRPVPDGLDLDTVFLHREERVVRRDGTVRFRGHFLEVRPSLVGCRVELRFDPFDPDSLPRVFDKGRFVCDTVLLDPVRNSMRRRHRPPLTTTGPRARRTGIDPLKQMQDEQIKRGGLRLSPPRHGSPKDQDQDGGDVDHV